MVNLAATSPLGRAPLGANPLVNRVSAPPIPQAQGWLKAYDGRLGPAVDLSQAVPGHGPAASFLERFARAALDPASARYGPILGDEALREAYARHVSPLYGASVEADDIAVTAGCNQAFFVAALAVAGPDSSVLLPTPWYFNHEMTLRMLGIEPVALPTNAARGFVPDPAEAEALVDETTRALVLVSPNNPTGAVYPPAAIEALHDMCRQRGLFLILDETYRDFLPAEAGPPHALFGRPDWRDGLIALYSFSKSYAIPGHRLGAMAAGPAVLDAAGKILDCVEICASRPSQAALAPSIAETGDWRAARTAEILARTRAFEAAMAALPQWRVESCGAYFAYLAHPFPGRSAEEVATALAGRLGLLVLPGSFFGPGQDGHLRVAFANVDEAGIARFAQRLALAGNLFEHG
ncbi:aminotransferase [Aureimonas populi]|uniref:Aminotransferase n=1 Tax=Aureimonas populi TaxID=1701758 RepID=A0ABW5CM66_9HYPH|nr:aminotransferase [Aureimonas populi]